MTSQNQLNKKIVSILEEVPGIVDFIPLFDSNDNKDVIKIDQIEKNLEISIGLVISRNITSRNIEKEVFDTLSFHLKNKYVLKKLNIYIKGVK